MECRVFPGPGVRIPGIPPPPGPGDGNEYPPGGKAGEPGIGTLIGLTGSSGSGVTSSSFKQ